jgi:hypothetical protein
MMCVTCLSYAYVYPSRIVVQRGAVWGSFSLFHCIAGGGRRTFNDHDDTFSHLHQTIIIFISVVTDDWRWGSQVAMGKNQGKSHATATFRIISAL